MNQVVPFRASAAEDEDESEDEHEEEMRCYLRLPGPWLSLVSLRRWSGTMEFVTILRFLLPFLGIGIFALAAKLIKPTKHIVPLALRLCWITGAVNLLWDKPARVVAFGTLP